MRFHFLYITTTGENYTTFHIRTSKEPLFGTENETDGGQNTWDSGELDLSSLVSIIHQKTFLLLHLNRPKQPHVNTNETMSDKSTQDQSLLLSSANKYSRDPGE